MNISKKAFRATAGALAALYVLAACSKNDDIPDDKATAKITAYNHTPDYIHQFYVDDAWGGNSFAYGGGGKFVCCLIYPEKWSPGLTAKVKWTTSSSDPNATGDAAKPHWHEAVVPIDQYSKPGTRLNVHFLPGGKVRLIVTDMAAGFPGYPGPDYPVAPPDFHFEPWKGAASVVEAYKRRHGLEGGDYSKVLSDEPASAPSLPKNVKLPPPPIIPEDEK
ncbi:DUF3304 domain-containing protein [Ralstonia solanacearum]|uniref:DUF3304 domain-containing protein n=2 Tax=Ralstonia solanacearum TaxID=305 RepID=A0AAW5ZUD8_RALSL|nr:DUF3304 domain-containing protein [Ralstonia solanacearum]MDB0507669.1 DUF3304 domain-containing protein [Ralstonia solanacearum]MDB0529816.1 DUF3304 domain-containing protein [Ralstonia solanacearum]MDB0543142.1 DUF3304 domain-containing protein [Ralstonia solanacearum]MDB0553311.1 DUF3304 domain-containing protein [Ralstonia solanacearum]MDB0558121.1 DUF3304 domain-containing protein [Ralstonia solanacearum]